MDECIYKPSITKIGHNVMVRKRGWISSGLNDGQGFKVGSGIPVLNQKFHTNSIKRDGYINNQQLIEKREDYQEGKGKKTSWFAYHTRERKS